MPWTGTDVAAMQLRCSARHLHLLENMFDHSIIFYPDMGLPSELTALLGQPQPRIPFTFCLLRIVEHSMVLSAAAYMWMFFRHLYLKQI